MADNSYNASYSAPSYSYGGVGANGGAYAAPSNNGSSADAGGLRRRSAAPTPYGTGNGGYDDDQKYQKPRRAVVEKLDFMFPKVDKEFTVKTKGGGVASLVATGLVTLLIIAEIITWVAQNGAEVSRTYVDNSLGKKMRVNMNITFPGLACDDLHLNVIDIAGDHQLDIQDTLKKKKLHKTGVEMSRHEIEVETNVHRKQQQEKDRILKEKLPKDYCGPCYGASPEGECCQTCDDVIEAYTKRKWKTDMLKFTSEQCIREGRDKQDAKKLIRNQGCHLSGYMMLNRVAGNFHIAMGEGFERDGRHIQTFNPEDAPNFNASHIIHELSFGPSDGSEPLTGTKKIVTESVGTTGLFQYFIKIVPTTYVDDAFPGDPELSETTSDGQKRIETNRYFITERFFPLMSEGYDDHITKVEGDSKRHALEMKHGKGHDHEDHHKIRNSVLPGVFFIYEIYPFAVEISKNYVPFTHLLIRIMATVGGVFTLARWADSIIYDRRK